MQAHFEHTELVREAEGLKFHRGAILALGQQLPPADASLEQLLAQLVQAKNELAFTHIIFAALGTGRPVAARHLVEGAALFPTPDLMASAAWHCAGPVSQALVDAVKRGLMGSEREAIALLVAATWGKEHPDFPTPADLITQARLLARQSASNFLALHSLMALANLVGDEGLKAVLKGFGVPEHPVLEKPLLEDFLPSMRRPPLEAVPESPPPTVLSGYTVRRAVERVGRNEPCPCGSGKKYKKCCFDKDRERLLHSSAVPGLTQQELRQQPELGLTHEGLESMRSYELCKIDPERVPPGLRIAYAQRLETFGLLEQAVSALEKWPWEREAQWVWDTMMFAVTRRANQPLLERLVRLNPEGLKDFEFNRLLIDLLLAGDAGRQQLDLVEAAALKALSAQPPGPAMVDFAHSLLDCRPALGIIAARAAIPMTNLFEGETLLEELLQARDKLNLPPDDPMCDFVEDLLFAPEDSPAEEPEHFVQTRRELQAKAREVRKLQKELDSLHEQLNKREPAPEPPKPAPRRAPSSLPQPPPSEPPQAQPKPAGLPEPEAKAMRLRIESLKALLKERHNERNLLRRELNSAKAQLEHLRQKPAPAPAAPSPEDLEARLLDSAELQGKQPVRLPQFPRRFEDLLASLPPAAARSCLLMIGRLAAGEASAFVGVKRLKALPDLYRQRIAEDYRLLFRLHPGRLEIVDLINRRDLERVIKAML